MKSRFETALYINELNSGILLLSRLLLASGIHVVAVSDRKDIFSKISATGKIDIVVWDEITDSSSLTYFKKLKNDEKTKDAPFIAVFRNGKITAEQAIHAGAGAYFNYPLDVDEFQRLITNELAG
jgi:DNA-binding NtrC family response regulator